MTAVSGLWKALELTEKILTRRNGETEKNRDYIILRFSLFLRYFV
jgi:hypothetical protein